MIPFAAIAIAAALSLLAAGYLAGARRGARARAALASDLADERVRAGELTATVSSLQEFQVRDGDLRRELATALAPLAQRDAGVQRLHEEMRTLHDVMASRATDQATLVEQIRASVAPLANRNGDVDELRREIRRAVAPLLRREQDAMSLRETMQDLLGPLVERQRLGQQLSQLDPGSGLRGELPRLLTAIGQTGGFATVLLSDEVGLPLAWNEGARDAEILAGVSSLLLTLTDRIRASGAPAPNAVIVRDEANQIILHRIFQVREERYLLTAVSKGGAIEPGALDPTLTALEGVLSTEAWN